MKLVQLVYTSRRTRLRDETAMQDLRSIARNASRRNAEAEISGHLFANQNCFFQVLEGRSTALMASFARIAADRRHKDVQVKALRVCEHRLFPQPGLHITDLTGPYISEALAAARLPWLEPQALDADHLVKLALQASRQGPMLTEYQPIIATPQPPPERHARVTDFLPWRARA
jgi:hypothetical protein